MATHNPLATDTPLDEMIRDGLHAEARRVSGSEKTFLRLMQRAQTEVPQLPPVEAPAETVMSATPVEAAPRPVMTLLHHTSLQGDPRHSVHARITEYRELMEMKMWRMVGSPGLAINI